MQGLSDNAPTVGFVVMQNQPVTSTIELPGRISASETSDFKAPVSGALLRRLFEEGSVIRAGQMLYEIGDLSLLHSDQAASFLAGRSICATDAPFLDA